MNDDGTVPCERCKGRGHIIVLDETKYFRSPIKKRILCQTCGGIGKFDWVEYVIGEKKLSKRNVAV